jgi:hypothetical protein
MEETLRQTLFALADASGFTRQTIGKRALNDNTFFARIERGDGFNVKTFDRVLRWLSDNWPASTKWPANVERPICIVSTSEVRAA